MVAYYSTRDLCERFRCSSRTLFRRMKRRDNPFPSPCIRHAGSFNLWDAEDISRWEQRERERCCLAAIGNALELLVTGRLENGCDAHAGHK